MQIDFDEVDSFTIKVRPNGDGYSVEYSLNGKDYNWKKATVDFEKGIITKVE